MILFDTHPDRYRHWSLGVDGAVATLRLDVREDAGIQPGYQLKLNSYDLGVDIELHDALQRIRFEHPGVKVVVLTSARERIFCSGANIYMLGASSHGWKVNFCKFTNETRCGMEDSSRHDGLKFLAALNGATAGGGYELALACDEIAMIDDRSSTVSLPEVPLLGVLPGTGGLTRLVDKRGVRRDRADVFCTRAEGLRADRALEWGMVDHIAPAHRWAELVEERVRALAAASDRGGGPGIVLPPIERTVTDSALHYSTLDVDLDHAARTATVRLRAPEVPPAQDIDAILAEGAAWWPLRFARELDDAILVLRTNFPALGLWRLESAGAAEHVLAADRSLLAGRDHWLVRETIGLLRRTLRRLDLSPRSMFAIIDRGSCFAGTFFEIALAADRSYMLDDTEAPAEGPRIVATEIGDLYPMSNGLSRLAVRFKDDPAALEGARAAFGRPLDAKAADALGLVTVIPDELDWDDEIRQAVEERASLSPDALTGMEASLRFAGPETPETKVYGRLTAWQNWVFSRPNAVGEAGGLKVYGSGRKADFDWERV